MQSPEHSADTLAHSWEEKTDLIRTFLDLRPRYEQLADEVAYILSKRIKQEDISYSMITGRAKSLQSFLEKVERKQYRDPLRDTTDLAGVRAVYLYAADHPRVQGIVEGEFKVVEKVDAQDSKEYDKFGYSAVHYLVRLGRKASGARYDDLKELLCEIQIRTVLQDAWAIIAHHLSYKQESAVPKRLRRKLSSLAGLLETADDQFDQVRAARQAYLETVKSSVSEQGQFLTQELNLDTLAEFLRWRFPKSAQELSETGLSDFVGTVKAMSYTALSDLDAALGRTKRAREALAKEPKFNPASALAELIRAIALEQPEYRPLVTGPSQLRSYEKCAKLIDKG